MKKTLKYIDGNSDKFWQIEVHESQYTVTYGRNGTSGVSQTKNFTSNEECLKIAEKLLAEKIKKGYSETGEVILNTKSEKKKSTASKKDNVSEILDEYDTIVKSRNVDLLLPFLKEKSKGNVDALKKQIKKNKRYWLTYIDLNLEPEFKKQRDYNWGIRGDNQITEIIALSGIALFNKSDILSFDEANNFLEKADNPVVFEILQWANPNWIESYILDGFRKSEWMRFDYKALRFLEQNNFVSFNPELFAFSLSRFNPWANNEKSQEFQSWLAQDKIAYERDIPLLFEYESNIQNSYYRENNSSELIYIWLQLFQQLLSENKMDRKKFIENAILIQTKEWNNNLKLFFRKNIEALQPTEDDLIPFQENIFTYFHNSNPVIVNYGSDLIKKIFEHPKFKTKSYLEWLEALMMRSECKAAIKNSLIVLEKISKKNPKFSKQICLLITDVFIISDLALQERTSKLIHKIGNNKDSAFKDKLSAYASYMQGSVKSGLNTFLNNDSISEELPSEEYHFEIKKVNVLIDEVEIPKTWNEILFLFGEFISSEEIIISEILLNVYITQRDLFPDDYTEQLQPYLKQLEKYYSDSVLKNYIKNTLQNKIPNKNITYEINDKEYKTLNTLRLIKPIIEKVFEKNKTNSKVPLLSFPTHKPHWVAPKVLLERIIAHQQANEPIDYVDLSIAISRMPRENIDEALPLLENLNSEMKELMSFCLGVTKEIKINSSSVINKLFHKIGGLPTNSEKIGLWAVACRTFYPNEVFTEFEKTFLKDIPLVVTPFNPEINFKENWNEWKDYHTKELVRSPSWMELNFEYPEKKTTPNHLLYSLDFYKKPKETWTTNYKLNSAENVYYWNSLMPQNNDPLAFLLLEKCCKITEGTNNELKGFLTVLNQPGFRFSDISTLVFCCCLFQEKKEIRLLASEVLINSIENKSIDITLFAKKASFLISNKYGVLLRFIEAIIALRDVSALHNSALFLLLDGIFKTIKLNEKLPTNFKKMVEIYADILLKTNNNPAEESKLFFEKRKDNNALKTLIKQILN